MKRNKKNSTDFMNGLYLQCKSAGRKSNFNYCPLIWHFCSAKSVKKIGKIQRRALRILYNDFGSDYKTFLDKSINSENI